MAVAVVFWNPGDPQYAAITLYRVKDGPDPIKLDLNSGLSIPEFFKRRGIDVSHMIKAFPEYIVPKPGKASWDTLKLKSLPQDENGLQKLADFLGAKVTSFICWRNSYPKKQFCLNPIG